MSLILLTIVVILIAYVAAKHSDKVDPIYIEIARWVVVLLGWYSLGEGLLNGLISFLVAQAVYVPAYNKLSGKDIWFIDDDTTLGKFIIKHLGEGSGRIWFYIQLAAAGFFILLKLIF